jgi:hypothetical protein
MWIKLSVPFAACGLTNDFAMFAAMRRNGWLLTFAKLPDRKNLVSGRGGS